VFVGCFTHDLAVTWCEDTGTESERIRRKKEEHATIQEPIRMTRKWALEVEPTTKRN